MKQAEWKGPLPKEARRISKAKFETLEEVVKYYSDPAGPGHKFLNDTKVILIGDSAIVRNYYEGKFAWLAEFIEMTEEEFNEQVCEESQ